MACKNVIFHHENKPAHISADALEKLYESRFKLLPHPSNSPDLAHCGSFLFPNLNIYLGGKRFHSNKEHIAIVKKVANNVFCYFMVVKQDKIQTM